METEHGVTGIERLDDLTSKVDTMYRAFYIGHGKHDPPFTTRMAMIEDAMANLNKNLSRIIWLLVTLIATTLVRYVYTGKG